MHVESLDGRWVSGHLVLLMVSGRTVQSDEGETADLVLHSEGRCALVMNGSVCHGQLCADGRLHWSDGDVWSRPSAQQLRRGGPLETALAREEHTAHFGPSPQQKPRRRSSSIGTTHDVTFRLKEMFPSWEREAIADVLASCGGDAARASAVLLEWNAERSPKAAAAPPRARLAPSPWHAIALPMRPRGWSSADTPGPPRILPRGEYDGATAERLARQYNSRHLAQVFKAASHWRHLAKDHHGAGGEPKASPAPPLLVAPSRPPNASPSREQQIEDGKALLEQRCAFLGLREVEMEDDGNCQFRAISQELFGTQRHHEHVRAAVVSYLRTHPGEYSPLFAPGEWQSYLADMANPRTWGDELTLRAAADTFEVLVHLVTSSDSNWYLVYHPSATPNADARQLFLAYVAPIHYNTVEAAR